jgi:hypothetical protein
LPKPGHLNLQEAIYSNILKMAMVKTFIKLSAVEKSLTNYQLHPIAGIMNKRNITIT